MTGNFPAGGPVPPGFGPGYPVSQRPKPSRAGVWLGAIACVLAAAALVVGVVALYEPATAAIASSPPTAPPQLIADEIFIDEADKPLCEDIGPLMREETDRTNTFLDLGA